MIPRWLYYALCLAVFIPMMWVVGLVLRPITNWTSEEFGWTGVAVMFAVFFAMMGIGYIRNRRAGRLRWQLVAARRARQDGGR